VRLCYHWFAIFGIFSWNVIAYWFFRYLEIERYYSSDAVVLATMLVAGPFLALGCFVGGASGDFFFKRTLRGKLPVSMMSVLLGAVLLVTTMSFPLDRQALFSVLFGTTAMFISSAAPDVVVTLHDVTLSEVRSTPLATQFLVEAAEAALDPWVAGAMAVRASLRVAILGGFVIAWVLCAIPFAANHMPGDIKALRLVLQERTAMGGQTAAIGAGPGC